MVVGSPVEPIGSWSSQGERSKFPPGAQLGFKAAAAEARRRRVGRVILIEDILIEDILIGWEILFWRRLRKSWKDRLLILK